MFNRITLAQKVAALALFAAVLMIAAAAYLLPTVHAANSGVEVAEPICPIVCPPGH